MSDLLPAPKRAFPWLILLVVAGLLAICECQPHEEPEDSLQRDLVIVGEISMRRLLVPTTTEKFFINESYSLDPSNKDASYDDAWLVSPCMLMLVIEFSLDEANGDISGAGTASLFSPADPSIVYGEDDFEFKVPPCESESLKFSYSEPYVCSAEIPLVFFNGQR